MGAGLGVGYAEIAASIFEDEAVIGFHVVISGEGEAAFVDVGGFEIAEPGFVVEVAIALGVAGRAGVHGAGGDDELDGDEGGEEVGGFFGEIAFVAGVEAEAAGGAAVGAVADGFNNGGEALDRKSVV